jgi:signal peptide peptidase SppA
MRLIDILTSPWAIEPSKLLEIRAVYETHLRGEKIDLKAVEAQLGRPLANEPKPYQVLDGGVAVVPMIGVLAKRANLFMQISGGTSTRIIGNHLAQAAADPQVASIILEVDSPGGHVDGVVELVEQVRDVRAGGKPVVAWISGVGASGAYWIASAAERVLIDAETALVGSIGVVATHVDYSGAQEKAGVKVTDITAGKYKRIASGNAPLSDEGRAEIQKQLDAIYSVFVEQVAANRGTSVDDVLDRMADGRVFIGRAAVEAGLVDGVSTFADLVSELRSRPGAGRVSNPNRKGVRMDLATLKADHPALVEAIQKEGHDAGLQHGIATERARIAAIDAAAVVGHDKLTAQAKAEGWDAGRYALAVLGAEEATRKAAAAAHSADAPKPAKDAPAPEGSGKKTLTRAAFNALPPDQRMALAKSGVTVTE